MKVTVVVPTGNREFSSPRTFHAADRFAADLAKALADEVLVFEGPLAQAPSIGFLLVFDLRHDDKLEEGSRVVTVAHDRSTIMARLEKHQLAGGIEKFQYTSHTSSDGSSYGLIGRKDVAETMKASVMTSGPYVSANYLPIANAGRALPQLVADYLRAFNEP